MAALYTTNRKGFRESPHEEEHGIARKCEDSDDTRIQCERVLRIGAGQVSNGSASSRTSQNFSLC